MDLKPIVFHNPYDNNDKKEDDDDVEEDNNKKNDNKKHILFILSSMEPLWKVQDNVAQIHTLSLIFTHICRIQCRLT